MPRTYPRAVAGIESQTRFVGFWRRFTPVKFCPFFNGDVVKLQISLKAEFQGQVWQQAVIKIQLAEGQPALSLNDTVEPLLPMTDWPAGVNEAPDYELVPGKWWSRKIELKGGVPVEQEDRFHCDLILERHAEGTELYRLAHERIADIEVAARGPFLMPIVLSSIGVGIAATSFLIGWVVS